MMIGNLFGGAVDSVTGQAKGSEGGSQFTLETNDLDETYGGNLTAGSWVDAAEFIVPAQTAYNVGYGVADNEATVGRFYANFEDGSSNSVEGQLRVVTRNANDKAVETDISSISTARLDSSISNYRQQVAVPEVLNTNKVGQDSKIVLQFKLKSSSSGTSIDFSASDMMLDLTEY